MGNPRSTKRQPNAWDEASTESPGNGASTEASENEASTEASEDEASTESSGSEASTESPGNEASTEASEDEASAESCPSFFLNDNDFTRSTSVSSMITEDEQATPESGSIVKPVKVEKDNAKDNSKSREERRHQPSFFTG